jgi:hypothetical protein
MVCLSTELKSLAARRACEHIQQEIIPTTGRGNLLKGRGPLTRFGLENCDFIISHVGLCDPNCFLEIRGRPDPENRVQVFALITAWHACSYGS